MEYMMGSGHGWSFLWLYLTESTDQISMAVYTVQLLFLWN